MADNKIELRSEKVRHIIGEIPSRIVRYGITIITIVILGLLAGAYFIPYPETISAKVQMTNAHQGTIDFPYKYVNTIARAVYKNPDYIFLDEATNSLDANNERMIVEHLDEFYKGKTVVIVAHRLSTVKNADQIVVLDKGKVVEIGNHEALTANRGAYYNLVKNQLELGN